MKSSLVYHISVACQIFTGMNNSIAPIEKLHLFSTDVNRSYIQCEGDFQSDIFTKPSKGFGLAYEKVLNIKGLCMDWQEVGTAGKKNVE